MKEKITLSNLIKVLIALLLITGLFYLWLSILHLRINPTMLKQHCSCINCEYNKASIGDSFQDFVNGRKSITPESEKIYGECYRENIFQKEQ